MAQALGTYVVGHLREINAVYGAFATVLVLLAWISLSVEIAVYAAELNVVLARRLWPRSIVQSPLTEADAKSVLGVMGPASAPGGSEAQQCLRVELIRVFGADLSGQLDGFPTGGISSWAPRTRQPTR